MLRVTVELVPYGVEKMSRTIVELCIANVDTNDSNVARYEAAGYHDRYGKIEEFAYRVDDFPRNDGVMALLRRVLESEQLPLDEVELAEPLLAKTRLAQEAD